VFAPAASQRLPWKFPAAVKVNNNNKQKNQRGKKHRKRGGSKRKQDLNDNRDVRSFDHSIKCTHAAQCFSAGFFNTP
jgi:hypothetical protein